MMKRAAMEGLFAVALSLFIRCRSLSLSLSLSLSSSNFFPLVDGCLSLDGGGWSWELSSLLFKIKKPFRVFSCDMKGLMCGSRLLLCAWVFLKVIVDSVCIFLSVFA
ncbi:hypothetical protein O6H91_14G070600 [Diphasiastrum complanatum]|uniref:Uncharacterized protein n=1 Tax=Diphasiastrum complanatum TaxID=34168 RepID=A0ACC2BQK9_DIPCM|nr:hypothetical protein O6H91_14G070600 [Diphasiastrum complanatum]